MEISPGMAEWRRLTDAQKTLAALVTAMLDAAGDWMINIVWSDEREVYCEAFERLGYGSIAVAIREAAQVDPDLLQDSDELNRLNKQVEKHWDDIWAAAESFASANQLLPEETKP